MATLGNLLYYIKAKNSEFKSKMDESKRKVKEFDGQVDKSKKKLQDWTTKAKKVGVVATTVFAGVATAGAYFVKAASDAQEMQNLLEVSFGAMSDDINSWAEETAGAVNRSNFEMKGFVSTAMAMTSSMVDNKGQAAEMSKTIAQLAVDLASFRNISDERAFEALTAALTGEAEALKRLGYNVQDTAVKQYALEKGITKSYESMSIAEKTTLRYQLILERLKDVMGDAERTSDSYANQIKGFQGEVRNLREELGTYLLPVATKLIGKLKDIVKWINDLPGPVKELTAKGMIIAGIITGIVGPLGLIVGYLPKIAAGLKLISTSFAPFLIGGVIITGLIAVVSWLQKLREETKFLKFLMRDVSQVIDISDAQKQLDAVQKRIEHLKTQREKDKAEWEKMRSGQFGAYGQNIAQNREWSFSQQDELNKLIEQEKKLQAKIEELKKKSEDTLNGENGSDAVIIFSETDAELEKMIAHWKEYISLMRDTGVMTVKDQINEYQEMLQKIDEDTQASEEKKLDMKKQIEIEIMRLEYQQAEKVKQLDDQMLDKKKQNFDTELQYQLYTLDQQEQALINSYLDQLGISEEFYQKREEIRALYDDLRQKAQEENAEKYIEESKNKLAELNRIEELMDNKMINMFVQVGFSLEDAQQNFETFKDSMINGLTKAITKGEDFLDTLKNIADQIAAMIIKKGIVEPAVDWMLSGLGIAHSGALVTTAGLVQDIPSYHTGGKIKPDERIIKAQTGERILSRSQNKAFEAGEYGKTEVHNHFNISAVDAKSFAQLAHDNPEAITGVFASDYSRNGVTRKILKGGG